MSGDAPARPATAPRPQPSRAEKSAARRAAILKAALDEFCEKGFAATRVEDVAARARVAKGTIYLNFKDKQALFEELIRSTLGAHIARLEAVRIENGQRMRDTIEAIGLPMIEAARTGRLGELMRLMIAESGRFPHLAEFYYHEVLARAMSAIRRLAREAVREGELAGEQLERFPQIIGAPVVVTLLWTTLFDKFAPLDSRGLLQAYLDLVFRQDAPKDKHPKGTRSGSRRIESRPSTVLAQTLGYDLIEAENGRVVVTAVPRETHLNPAGTVHGGLAATMLDSCMGLAVQSTLDKGVGSTTLEFKISFLRPITPQTGAIKAEGVVISRGRRVGTAEGRVTDSQGRLLVHGTTTCLIFENQS